MPLTNFRCPDKEVIPTKSCLTSCRMEERCVTYPTLLVILTGQREWSGQPSTTQLINGTMQEWLKILKPYTVAPKERAYALLGTAHHLQLAAPKGDWFTEEQVASGISGVIDLLLPDERSPGYYSIVDYKTFGSYKLVRILGLVKEKKAHPTEVYKKSGSWGKAGAPKMINEFHVDPAAVDMWEEELQLNQYRMLAEAAGFKISNMKLQVTVRDGGLQVAMDRGITEQLYYPIYVRRMVNSEVADYFGAKREKLLQHLTSLSQPLLCSDRESWDGRRCKDWCDVAVFCSKGMDVQEK